MVATIVSNFNVNRDRHNANQCLCKDSGRHNDNVRDRHSSSHIIRGQHNDVTEVIRPYSNTVDGKHYDKRLILKTKRRNS